MMSVCTRLSTLVLFTALLLTASPAFAQLELDQDGRVGIGGGPFSLFRLSAFNSQSGAIFASYGGSNNAAAILGQAHSHSGSGVGGEFHGGKMGLSAYATKVNPDTGPNGYNTGIYTKASSADVNNGVHAYAFKGRVARAFRAHAHGDGTTDYAFGIVAFANGSATNAYGVYGDVYTATGKTGYGVFGRSLGEGTNYGGYFHGDLRYTGTFAKASDAKFKEAVEALADESLLDQVLALEPRRYRYKQDAVGRRMGFPAGEQLGFIAQELEAVFPALVQEEQHTLPAVEASGAPREEEGLPPEVVIAEEALEISYKTVNYVDLIPVLVGAIQEQQAEIAALKAALGKLGVTVE